MKRNTTKMKLLNKSSIKYLAYPTYLICLIIISFFNLARAAYYEMGTLLLISLTLIIVLAFFEVIWFFKQGVAWILYLRAFIAFLITAPHLTNLVSDFRFSERYIEFLVKVLLLSLPILIIVIYWIRLFRHRHLAY